MSRIVRRTEEARRSLWRKAVDLALTDVRVLAKGTPEELLEAMEERLIAADFGVATTLEIVERLEASYRRGKIRTRDDVIAALGAELHAILGHGEGLELAEADDGPTVYLVVGVNGVGKTTSIAKLAHALVSDGRSVLVAAADTYRAGAVEQLGVWAERVGAEFVRGQEGGDPAAVAFDALEAALAREVDVVIIDTAGRLHTNRGLMGELAKIDRVVRRKIEGAPHETLMVLDATVGQNALSQLRSFSEVVEPSGLVLAKMDSSARGGIVVALTGESGVPVKLVGTGEGLDDLESFDADVFVEGVLEDA